MTIDGAEIIYFPIQNAFVMPKAQRDSFAIPTPENALVGLTWSEIDATNANPDFTDFPIAKVSNSFPRVEVS